MLPCSEEKCRQIRHYENNWLLYSNKFQEFQNEIKKFAVRIMPNSRENNKNLIPAIQNKAAFAEI